MPAGAAGRKLLWPKSMSIAELAPLKRRHEFVSRGSQLDKRWLRLLGLGIQRCYLCAPIKALLNASVLNCLLKANPCC